jgi:hypothetical protein
VVTGLNIYCYRINQVTANMHKVNFREANNMQLSHDVILYQKTNYPETKRYRYQHGFHRTRGQLSAGKSLLVKVMMYLTFH